MQLDAFVIGAGTSVREALRIIDANHQGLILIVDATGAVTSLATDGDIRRHLMGGGTLEDAVDKCANGDFVWVGNNTPRELILKNLDDQIHFIPVLDEMRRLVDVVSRDHNPLRAESSVYARSRAPVRVSFSGGGSDLTSYFLKDQIGAVINSTISIYSHATLLIREDQRIIIRSLDLEATLDADDLAAALAAKGPFGLIQALLKVIKPDFGFELFLHSDFPMSSGLGGSAVVSASILGCFNKFRRDEWDLYELAEIAYQAERHLLGVKGGWQDQYATVFGGFNFMEFRMDQNIVHPLWVHPDTMHELEESLILCDTGITHDSGEIHQDQLQQMAKAHVLEMLALNVKLSYEMRDALLRGRLRQFGESLHRSWELKRRFSDKVSTPLLDKIYTDAKFNGAIGGKILGAGGGGFFLFYVTPHRKHQLISYLKSSGLKIHAFRFESQGLQAWTVRESKTGIESLPA